MRIITGRYRGRKLSAPEGDGVRPATDKVRGSIFNILQNRLDVSGIAVLDLFAGSGSLGFEALSRGAASVTFVDDSSQATEAIRANAGALGCADLCEVVREDALRFLSRNSGIFPLIFADPPYAWAETADLPRRIHSHGMLAGGGYLIIEHGRATGFPGEPPLLPVLQRQFGNTVVSFFTFT